MEINNNKKKQIIVGKNIKLDRKKLWKKDKITIHPCAKIIADRVLFEKVIIYRRKWLKF